METVQQNGRFTLFSSKFPSSIYSILFAYCTLFGCSIVHNLDPVLYIIWMQIVRYFDAILYIILMQYCTLFGLLIMVKIVTVIQVYL